ncbi:MAG: transcription termination factor NusA [Bacteroidales bacterium]|nr:transcription termination factor NusA [Bacteroidales bacterium]
MAKKASQEPVQTLIETFREFNETKQIDETTLLGVLEESFRSVIVKLFGSDDNYNVIVNPDKGDLEITRSREVVADDELVDSNRQIPLTEAQQIESDFEIGEEVTEQVNFESFGRRAILTLRQTLASKILELEHETLYNKYKDRVGELITAEVYQVWKSETLLVDSDHNDLLLPKSQQIPRDFYRKGENIRAVIYNVDNANGNPKIYVSRTSPEFLRCLLQLEIPEIAEGVIRLVDVARIPGDRAKISVATNDPNIDPVGACVGVGGSRINSIVKELHNESIDVIPYSDNTELYIQRALNPARILEINIDNEKRKAEVYLEPDQVSLAIGKGGQNIKLASMLTGYTIDVFRDMNGGQVSDDINLDEFSDEVDQWVIDAIKNLGFATAKDVLKAPRNMLVTKADLEEETVDHLLAVLRKEFKEFENKD